LRQLTGVDYNSKYVPSRVKLKDALYKTRIESQVDGTLLGGVESTRTND